MSIAGGDNVPIEALFAEQEVAQGSTDKIGFQALFAEVVGCEL